MTSEAEPLSRVSITFTGDDQPPMEVVSAPVSEPGAGLIFEIHVPPGYTRATVTVLPDSRTEGRWY